ncbi:hypothetical protein GJU40_05680 [Bacillus lacus]|uniref:Small peptidoglycan-associated lipoprotein n=1 Tax=Metabacillus lacus TaxID=1983721 RepID=A0A7X2IXY8_9BACI|nr:hypothetical protein [Metabacillus lacus]MRX71664.1 hypothetical protein [Metabacillus lacus]
MKKTSILIMFMPLIILSACSHLSFYQKEHGSVELHSDRQILFFSNESRIDKETAYYDALLDLKKDFPQEINGMIVYPEKKKNPYKVDSYPAIIVIENETILLHLEGSYTAKDEILKPLKKILNQ